MHRVDLVVMMGDESYEFVDRCHMMVMVGRASGNSPDVCYRDALHLWVRCS